MGELPSLSCKNSDSQIKEQLRIKEAHSACLPGEREIMCILCALDKTKVASSLSIRESATISHYDCNESLENLTEQDGRAPLAEL